MCRSRAGRSVHHFQNQGFYLCHSGWGAGQLEEELAEKTWITRKATRRLAFYKNIDEIWKEALYDLGGEYQQMINYPKDPQLN